MAIRVRWAILGGLAATLAGTSPAAAQTLTLTGHLTGAQEPPPPTRATTGSGFASLAYYRDLQLFTVFLRVQDLVGTTVAVGPGGAPAHIHLAPPGVNGPIVLPIVGVPVGIRSFTFTNTYAPADLLGFGVSSANVTLLLAALDGLVATPPGTPANLYANVHTTAYPDGELRADLFTTPEPSTWALTASGVGLIGVVLRRRRA